MTKTTHIISILDRSGSMAGSEAEVIGAYNAFIKEQQKLAKKENVTLKATLVLFDHLVETVYEKTPVEDVKELNNDTYNVRGTTALYDAVGQTINAFKDKKRVIFFIETDGWENSSKDYSSNSIKALVKQKTDSGWDFNFVGADLDSATSHSLGSSMGISKSSAFNKDATGYATRNVNFTLATSAYIKK